MKINSLPWSLDSHTCSPGAYLKDNKGDIIGIFPDWRHAQFVIDVLISEGESDKTLENIEDALDLQKQANKVLIEQIGLLEQKLNTYRQINKGKECIFQPELETCQKSKSSK